MVPLNLDFVIPAHIGYGFLRLCLGKRMMVGRPGPGDFCQIVLRYKMEDQVFCLMIHSILLISVSVRDPDIASDILILRAFDDPWLPPPGVFLLPFPRRSCLPMPFHISGTSNESHSRISPLSIQWIFPIFHTAPALIKIALSSSMAATGRILEISFSAGRNHASSV